MSDKNVKIKQHLKFTENVNDSDFFPLKKNINGDDRWARIQDLKQLVLDAIEIPEPVNESINSYMLDYGVAVELDAVWYGGNLNGKISTETNTVEHSVPRKWHFSRIDLHSNNLDESPNGDPSLFEYLVDATSGTTVMFKVYNREDSTQYAIYSTEEPIVRANPTITGTAYYDLELNATFITSNGIIGGTIQNPTVALVIGRSKDVVRNNTDTYTSYEKVKNVISLSDAEWGAIPTPDANTLFITPCDGQAEVVKQETIDAALDTLLNNTKLAYVTSAHTVGAAVTSIGITDLETIIPSGYNISVYSIQEDAVQSFVTASETAISASAIEVVSQEAAFNISSANYVILSNYDIVKNSL